MKEKCRSINFIISTSGVAANRFGYYLLTIMLNMTIFELAKQIGRNINQVCFLLHLPSYFVLYTYRPTVSFTEMPMGQVPVLEIDDTKMLCQAKAISRYLAKQFGVK